MALTHSIAEGEVTFKSLQYMPKSQHSESFNKYGQATENIKLYVSRVFITDNFEDVMPSYWSFTKGVVDFADLPFNMSRETLQQHRLVEVIKKKLGRKALYVDEHTMVMEEEKFEEREDEDQEEVERDKDEGG